MKYDKAIRLIRASTGLNKTDFAKAVGLDLSLISRYETGERIPTKENIKKISESLAISPSLIDLIASPEADLNKINEREAAKIGKILLSTQLDFQNNTV